MRSQFDGLERIQSSRIAKTAWNHKRAAKRLLIGPHLDEVQFWRGALLEGHVLTTLGAATLLGARDEQQTAHNQRVRLNQSERYAHPILDRGSRMTTVETW